jgi:hypothetical protein
MSLLRLVWLDTRQVGVIVQASAEIQKQLYRRNY